MDYKAVTEADASWFEKQKICPRLMKIIMTPEPKGLSKRMLFNIYLNINGYLVLRDYMGKLFQADPILDKRQHLLGEFVYGHGGLVHFDSVTVFAQLRESKNTRDILEHYVYHRDRWLQYRVSLENIAVPVSGMQVNVQN